MIEELWEQGGGVGNLVLTAKVGEGGTIFSPAIPKGFRVILSQNPDWFRDSGLVFRVLDPGG